MAKTHWTTDTCGCKLAIEWDAKLPHDKRTHTYSFVQRCEMHEAMKSRPADVVEDNRAKNQGMAEVSRVSGVPAHELAWERHDEGFSVRKADPKTKPTVQ